MAYLVNITGRAERDLAELYRLIKAEYSDTALNWYRGLVVAILSLKEKPNRCAVTPETESCRHLLYGQKPHIHRVIFRILEKQKIVEVIHIRYGARQEFSEPDRT